MNTMHSCIGSACAICHPRCECHDCTQARAKERNPFPDAGYPQKGGLYSGQCVHNVAFGQPCKSCNR